MSDLEAAGLRLVFVGNGAPHFARSFAAEQHVSAPLYTDPSLKTYAALEFRSGVLRTLGNPQMFGNAFRAWTAGHRQSRTQGPPMQQGGVVVVTPDGRVPYLFASETAGDHPNPDDVIRAARAAPQ